ncbi:MAG: orotidine 5'-phosphate decarboxylase [candidate division Zixibacteria bacterium SM23_73_3]|nr:MAG: orotidine 5'-phosphate decarboxylase [candidate division Zixibacteria bacterium SM23_73_3]
MTFVEKLLNVSRKNNSLVCVGLDTDLGKIPEYLLKEKDPISAFNQKIIEFTSDLVCAYKPNMAFYEVFGSKGWDALKKTCEYIPQDIPIIIDAKRGDIGNTARMYAKAFFEELRGDAVTVNPYMGRDAILPFLKYEEKCAFVLCLTSNEGAKDFQLSKVDGKPLYEIVAEKVLNWNAKNNCGLVVGATYPEQLKRIREIVPSLPILIPGVGAQAGDIESTIRFGTDANGELAIINSSRAILYASRKEDFAQAAGNEALRLRDLINLYRKK